MAVKNQTKFTPRKKRKYIVTDQCFWEKLTEEERLKYNPHDPKRMPHTLQLVDQENGTIVNLPSGSIIEVIKCHEPIKNKKV